VAAPAAPPAPVEAPKPVELTLEQKVKVYQDCWAAFNAKDLPTFSGCFADTAVSEQVDSDVPSLMGKDIVEDGIKPFLRAFPDLSGELQLVLANGNTVASVALIRGTHQGPLAMPSGEIPPTNKKIGYLMGHLVEFSPDGKVLKEVQFTDPTIMLSQLGVAKLPARKLVEKGAEERPVVLATGSDTEKANLAEYAKAFDAFNKHDAKALEPLYADDIVVSFNWMPADLAGKKALAKYNQEGWKAFSDFKLTPKSSWAAGDYVVSVAEATGTNDGPMPSAKIWRKTGKSVKLTSLEIIKIEKGKAKRQ
jgi:predicted ester cyclase